MMRFLQTQMAAFAASACFAGALWAAPHKAPGPPRFTTLPPDSSLVTSGGTVPTWTGMFNYKASAYTFAMVGTNPAFGSGTTTVPVEIVPIIFKFSDGTTLDPTATSCGDTASAVSRVLNSPLFQTADYAPGGTDVGTTQYEDAFERANFWSLVSTVAPDYHVLLGAPTVEPAVTLNVPASWGKTLAGACSESGSVNNGNVGTVALLPFQVVLRYVLAPKYSANTLPIFLFYNTFFYEGAPSNCCVLGFHTAYGKAPNQLTVAAASYSDPGLFNVPIEDIHALSHEIGEWMDDPFTTNAVPGWKGGQVSTCSNALEVGDPVTGIASDTAFNGFTYHPEDLVFLPWFEKAPAPTSSVNGWYTFLNSYSAPSARCF